MKMENDFLIVYIFYVVSKTLICMISFSPQSGNCDTEATQMGLETPSSAYAGVTPAFTSGSLAPYPASSRCGTSASSFQICKWFTVPSHLSSQVLSNERDNACESGASTMSLRKQLLKLLL